MKQEKTHRSLKTKALAWLQMREKEVLYTGELQKVLKITPKQEANLLNYLRRSGILIPLTKGIAIAPLKLPPGRWSPSPYKILALLMKELDAQYQITGLYAFNRYGLSTQVPVRMMIYNTKLSGTKMIGGLAFDFVRVDATRLGEAEVIEMPKDKDSRVYIGSLPRTLFDAVYDYKRFNTLPRAYEWIAQKKSDSNLMKKLVEITIQFGNVGTQRRIGFVLSSLGINPALCRKLWRTLPKSSSLIPLIPGENAVGPIDRQWGIIINGKYRNLSASG